MLEKTRYYLNLLEEGGEVAADEAQSMMRELEDVIRFHNQKYYIEDDPVIADSEYDRLFHFLQYLEHQYPMFLNPDSPTQRIAVKLEGRFPKIKHLVPRLSLDNTYNAEELRDFDGRVRKILGDTLSSTEELEYVVELKFDGSGVNLVYEKDRLLSGATRGDGEIGEEITSNVRMIDVIKETLPLKSVGINQLEVRGEVVMPKQVFAELNVARQQTGENLLANPRNAAAGTLRQLDSAIVRSRRLSAYFYEISYADGPLPQTINADHDFMRSLGLPVSPYLKVVQGINAVIQVCAELESKRDSFPFEIDGAVIKVNRKDYHAILQETLHHPRWAIAFKFQAKQATTKVVEIVVQVGRTGVLTPVAELEPVEIGGVKVKRVSLHNADYIAEKDLRRGDTILVQRAGDVIPEVVKVITEARTGGEQIFEMPTTCPRCGGAVSRLPGEVAIRCSNVSCPAVLAESLRHFASRGAMNIEGLGDSVVVEMMEYLKVRKFSDLYRFSLFDLATIPSFRSKSAQNLYVALQQSKKNRLYRFIYALGIRYVGIKTAQILEQQINNFWDLTRWSIEELQAIPEVGVKIAQSIYDYLHNENNLAVIREGETLGINLVAQHDVIAEGILTGKKVVFTGKLQHLTREQAGVLVREAGGEEVGSLSKEVNYLIVGDSPGSKLEKAKALGINILNELQFISLLGRNDLLEGAQSLFSSL